MKTKKIDGVVYILKVVVKDGFVGKCWVPA
jgi:hypothetical protein